MVRELTLFDLFGEANVAFIASVWPRAVQRSVGLVANWSTVELSAWLSELNNGVTLAGVRTGAAGDRIAVEAQLQLDNASTSYAEGFPFVLSSMPDVEFRIQSITDAGKFVQLFASASATGAEVVLEGLPVEIRLPGELIEPHPTPDDHPSGIAEMEVGSFTPGSLDDLKVVYRRGDPTSIFVHVRLHMTEDFEFTIRPSVPIDFGKCMLSGLPCLALHDFSLIPSPSFARRDVEWLRHSVTPLLPVPASTPSGLFTARSVYLDPDADPIKDLAGKLNSHAEQAATTSTPDDDPTAEFVLDDVVVPFYSVYVIPIPRHITVGVRRRILNPEDERQIFSFEQAPIHTHFSRDPVVGLLVESFFYRSLPIADISTDLGLSFSAAIFFGDDNSPQSAFEIGLDANYTPLLGYRRDFSSTTGMPEPGTGAAAVINAILHWEIATTVIDIMAFRVGYSLGRWLGEGKSFGDCFEATADIFITSSSSDSPSAFQLRSLNGQKASFALQGLGWRQGNFHFEGINSPDGVAIILFNTFAIIIREIGLVAESGASYLSFSAGLAVQVPSGFYGEVSVRRLRFRVAGNPDAPFFKLDGFFGKFKSSTVLIEFGGYFTERVEGADTQVRELGLTGTVGFELSAVEYLFGLDLLIGSRTSPAESFDYFMFQAFFRGSVVIAWFELRGARVLFANNMQPKLAPLDRESRDLRYFSWYKSSNPLTVSGDRRLTAWQAKKDAWALGIGVNASIAGLGKAIELGVFVLLVFGPDEHGFLIVGEVFLLKKSSSSGPPKPVGYFALEWDGKNDRFSLVIGVDLTIESFLSNPPDWSKNIARLTGTLFISNDPGTFAIGRLADMRTWLSLLFDIDLWVFKTFIQFGLCIEYVEGPTGPKGFGLFVRLEGGINAGIVRVTYNAGFGILVLTFQTGSSDYAAAIWIEAGLRIILFGFLRFGLSARAEFRTVGAHPTRGELRAEIRLETPWFLPDVTWTFEIAFGDLQPQDLATSVSALRVAGSKNETTSQTLSVYVERFDSSWNGEGAAPTFSINQLRAPTRPEATRLANFAASDGARPIPTDSTISIEWSVAVNDQLGLSSNVAPNLGNQSAGDLTLKYDLVRIAVRRRARFGTDQSWKNLEDRVELTADFSDPNGVDLAGSFAPQELTKFWDMDVRIGGEAATKKLLINATAPFEFKTSNPEVDEETIKQNPNWPCCDPRDKKRRIYKLHRVDFKEEQLGADIIGPRLFSESQSRFTLMSPAYVRLDSSGTVYAFVESARPGPFFRAELDEDAAFCFVNLMWAERTGAAVRLELVAFDAAGDVAGRTLATVTPGGGFQGLVVAGQGPIRRFEGRILGAVAGLLTPGFAQLFLQGQGVPVGVERAVYVGLRDYLEYLGGNQTCGSEGDDFTQGYEGRGKLFFLPNHEYELAFTTRVTVAHPSTSAASADVEEFVYFKTKGLPGLNAVARVGEEVEPYVNTAYAGGKGILYREEPVTLAFKEDFHVAVPLALRPPGTAEERTTLLRMQLLVQPDTAPTLQTPFTATGTDWIVEHRTIIVVGLPQSPWLSLSSDSETVASITTSTNPYRARLAGLTQREQMQCELGDPRQVVHSVLVAPPQGTTDPSRPSQQLWAASARATALVRLEGAGFVDRRGFEAYDDTAFSYALDAAAGDSTAWAVLDGELRASAGSLRRFAIFGEPTWNHLSINVSFKISGSMAGVGVALPVGGIPSRGLFAVVEETLGERRLTIYRRNSGVEFVEVNHVVLPDPADADAPLTLSVTAYDDRLRASVGEVTVEADRDELREGCLCLITQGAAQFTSLQVTGLDIYTFPFAVSRFISFADHIHSFDGTVDVITPDALGPGSTSATTAGLWAATQGEVATVMQTDGDAAARQALFDRWVRDLGIPLKDELTTLEISRLEVSSATQLLVIESPEPLDFTEEVEVTLSQRVLVSLPPFDVSVDPAVGLRAVSRRVAGSRGRIAPLTDEARARLRLETLGNLREEMSAADKEIKAGELRAEAPPSRLIVNDLIRSGGALCVELDASSIPDSLLLQKHVVFVEAVEDGGERRLRFFAGSIERKAGGRRAFVRAIETDELKVKAAGASSIVSESLEKLGPDTVAIVDKSLANILGLFHPHYVYQTVQVRILQDGPGRRAIIIPVSGPGTRNLTAGTYRMKFNIERQRWKSNDPPDDLNRYQDEATLSLIW